MFSFIWFLFFFSRFRLVSCGFFFAVVDFVKGV